MLSNAAFGFFQATRIFEGNGLDSFWERIAESNVPSGLRGTGSHDVELNDVFVPDDLVLGEVKRRVPVRVLAYCLTGNHWQLGLGNGDVRNG